MSKKRSFSGSFGFSELKRQCFEIQKGVKRGREDEEQTVDIKRQQTLTMQSGHKMKLSQLREENARLRAEAHEKDRLIKYGAGEIRRLNADILCLKHQVNMMEDYVAAMEGRSDDRVFYIS